MTSNNFDMINLLESKFGDKIQIQKGVAGEASIVANNDVHRDVLQEMINADEKTGVTAISGVDLGGNLAAYYHVHTAKSFFTIKTAVPRTDPKIRSVVDIHPGAKFHELEVTDLFGITFVGNEFNGHLVLSENWPDGVYPLRKDVDPTKVKLVPTPEREANTPAEGRQVKIIIGPQHPALLEPEKFSVTVDGETVTRVDPRIGYVHRGIEKSTESRTYLQDIYLVERVCGICNPAHAYGFVGAVEKY